MCELREQGLSIRKIAAELKCNPSTVQRACKPS
ncbi:helix-turn-helix domain-containing protein [Vibrio sp. PNB23_22_6]